MEPKIPLSCISNLNDQNKKYIDLIKCPICGGVYFEPIYLKLDKYIACENCFFNNYKINKDNIKKSKLYILYEKINVKKLESLFKFNYYFQIFKLNNSNNKKEYQYDNLIIHLKICDNQIVFKDLCRCTNILKIYLKDLYLKKNELDLLIENKILEKELEMEKFNINDKKFKIFLDREREKEKENNFKEIQKKYIKKKFIGKKRNTSKKNQ